MRQDLKVARVALLTPRRQPHPGSSCRTEALNHEAPARERAISGNTLEPS